MYSNGPMPLSDTILAACHGAGGAQRTDGPDEEQVELGNSAHFWELIVQRRAEGAVTRADLEDQLDAPG